jgi:hypothetical protein
MLASSWLDGEMQARLDESTIVEKFAHYVRPAIIEQSKWCSSRDLDYPVILDIRTRLSDQHRIDIEGQHIRRNNTLEWQDASMSLCSRPFRSR